MPHVYSVDKCVSILSSPSKTLASLLQNTAHMVPHVRWLDGFLKRHGYVLLGQRTLWMPFLPQIHKRILCPSFSDLPFYDTEIGHRACRTWEGGSFPHLLGFWQKYLLSEGWGLACHVFSQSSDGSRPTHLAFVFFPCIKLPIFHFRWEC